MVLTISDLENIQSFKATKQPIRKKSTLKVLGKFCGVLTHVCLTPSKCSLEVEPPWFPITSFKPKEVEQNLFANYCVNKVKYIEWLPETLMKDTHVFFA